MDEVDEDVSTLSQLRNERDLYLELLSVSAASELEGFAEKTLALFVDACRARVGYFELRDGNDEPIHSIATGLSAEEVDDARVAISRGIVAQGLTRGEPIATASALLDPRFESRKSVQTGAIGAVLCVPIGGAPPDGVLYLERPMDEGPFDEADIERAHLVARHIAPYAAQRVASVSRQVTRDATVEARQRLRADEIVGRSPALGACLDEAALMAPFDVNILLTGDSGTGKTQLARVIHESSKRSGAPFQELNCAALPAALVENELFGAVQGAHSTASTSVRGKIAAAEAGTLFLDEIGEMPLESQAKLLQFLQTHEYFPLGASESVRANVRVIAATNSDLQNAILDGTFREDLFYRLNVMPIRLPSLSERVEDIPEIAAAICATSSKRHDLPTLRFSPSALDALVSSPWPGNVRELHNRIEAACIRAASSDLLELEVGHLFPSSNPNEEEEGRSLQSATRRFQRGLLARTLEQSNWNVAETARTLDIARSYVYKLIRSFGLEREK